MTRRQRVRSLEYRTRRAARHARRLEGATTKLTEFYAAAGAGPSLPPVPDALAAEVDRNLLAGLMLAKGLAAQLDADADALKGGQSQTTVQ